MTSDELLPCGLTYTGKIEFDEDIIFKIVIYEDNLISVFTDDSRGKGCGLRGKYQFESLLELLENIKTHLGLNPKFEVVRGEE